MAAGHNERSNAAGALRVGLVAGDEHLPRLADAVASAGGIELVAQGGMPRQAALEGVAWFDDLRQLAAQAEVEALLVAASPRVVARLAETIAAEGKPLWQLPPLGRGFAEALETAGQLRSAEVSHQVASWWSYQRRVVLEAIELDAGLRPLFSEVHVSAPGPEVTSWRAAESQAGGGVLAQDAYASLEALTGLRGMPESVFGVIGSCRRPSAAPPRETEGVAVVTMRYEDGGIAVVRAAWDIPPFGHHTIHHGRSASLHYTPAELLIRDADGEITDRQTLDEDVLAADLRYFAARLRGGQPAESPEVAIRRHLMVSAILETAYLSSRTQQPEDPRRLFEVQKWPSAGR